MSAYSEWTGHIACFKCGKKIRIEEIYEFNDLLICGSCNHFLIELKKKKPPHPMEDFNDKLYMDEKPKRKKKI